MLQISVGEATTTLLGWRVFTTREDFTKFWQHSATDGSQVIKYLCFHNFTPVIYSICQHLKRELLLTLNRIPTALSEIHKFIKKTARGGRIIIKASSDVFLGLQLQLFPVFKIWQKFPSRTRNLQFFLSPALSNIIFSLAFCGRISLLSLYQKAQGSLFDIAQPSLNKHWYDIWAELLSRIPDPGFIRLEQNLFWKFNQVTNNVVTNIIKVLLFKVCRAKC